MKVLIVYKSRYGSTEERAKRLAGLIGGGASLVDLGRVRRPSLDGFDVVLIGGPIFAGKLPRAVLSFCERERDKLIAMKVGLFVCCLYKGEEAVAQLRSAFPDWLAAHAFASDWLGGELHQDRLSYFHRFVAKPILGPIKDVSNIREDATRGLAEATLALGRLA